MVRIAAILLFLLVPAAPGQYVDTQVGGTWTWTPAEYAPGVAAYEVQIRYGDSGEWYQWVDDVSATPVNSLIVFRYTEIPQPTPKYSVRVRAVGYDGEVGLFSDASSLEYEPLGEDASPARVSAWDVNGDRRVDIVDLMMVSRGFGDSGPGSRGDVNADGVVDILDLVLVGTHSGEISDTVARNTPQLQSDEYAHLLERWLIEVRIASDGSELFQEGIMGMERLLAEMRPDHTALLSNYPNPFNPDT